VPAPIRVIQIDDAICRQAGFTDMNFITVNKHVTGWEKAMHYFSGHPQEVWVVEDDVFFYNEGTLRALDAAYPTADLVCSPLKPYEAGAWLWDRIQPQIPPPYVAAMVCAIRVSPRLLAAVAAYAAAHQQLFFLEALLPTLCAHHAFACVTPPELRTVVWRATHRDVTRTNVYHPVKKISTHPLLRVIAA
jgi:hypothetical protein